MNALGNRAQSFGAVINRIHRRNDGEENLCRADVARCFVAADVLLARLQGEAICGSTSSVMRHAHQSAGHVTFEFVARGEVSRVWSATSQRHAKTLRVTDRNVGAE